MKKGKRLCFFGGRLCRHSEAEAESVNSTYNAEEYEHCIVCGKVTCIPLSMPIDWRENYEIGLGQVCAECAKKQQEEMEQANTLSNAQILQAVEQSRKENKKK